VPDILIHDDTLSSPVLRHEVPLAVPDPFLYAEIDGRRIAVVSSLEAPRVRELPGIEARTYDEFGWDELLAQGLSFYEVSRAADVRAVLELGIREAVVPPRFPLDLADRLRAEGIDVRVDRDEFARRRRVKNEHELAGIRRAQRAAEAGMDAARELLRRGAPLEVAAVKAAIEQRFVELGCSADEFIVSHGWQSAIGHHMGDGTIEEGEPIVIDLFPRDRESGCFGDMTRTYVIGEPSDELVEWHRLCKQALDRALAETRPGVTGRELFDGTCEIFEGAGYTTQRTKEEGEPLENGFIHSLGHGIGLAVHEDPSLGMTGHEALVAGDVITIEPGLYRAGVGGCRLEDLVVVTEDGCENYNDYPYDLEP